MRGHRRIATSLAALVLLLLPSAAAAETREHVPWGAGGYRYIQNTLPTTGILGGENLLAIRATDRGVERYLDVRVQAEFVDEDGDGIGDRVDNCRTVPNNTQTDTNQNGVGNACDIGSTNCEGASCFTDRSTPAASTSVTATKSGDDPGWLYLGVNVNPPGPPELLDCANSTEFVPDVFTLDGSDNISEKLVRLKISWHALFDGWRASGLARVQFCFSAPKDAYEFKVRPGYGKVETYEYNGDGVGGEETWYKGVLPECRTLLGKTSPPPCVSGRALLRDGIELRARIPGGAADPRYH